MLERLRSLAATNRRCLVPVTVSVAVGYCCSTLYLALGRALSVSVIHSRYASTFSSVGGNCSFSGIRERGSDPAKEPYGASVLVRVIDVGAFCGLGLGHETFHRAPSLPLHPPPPRSSRALTDLSPSDITTIIGEEQCHL